MHSRAAAGYRAVIWERTRSDAGLPNADTTASAACCVDTSSRCLHSTRIDRSHEPAADALQGATTISEVIFTVR